MDIKAQDQNKWLWMPTQAVLLRGVKGDKERVNSTYG